MIVSLMVMSLIIGHVDQMRQSFLLGCVLFAFPNMFLTLSLWILTLNCKWEIVSLLSD